MTQHRREIDGLRSIAVLAVVLYHFGLPGIPGGFVGVDIFFVISGFLIGGILWRELRETGRISLKRFYERRIKRLAPAYIAMCLVTFAVGWMVLLPFEFRELGKQLIAATVYLSNVLFWRQAGYFDAAAEEKPLLHTWSLAVEEQFYIVLPLLLLLLLRWPRVLAFGLVVFFVLSLAASVVLTPTMQTWTFYLFPFRAWELLAGVLLAMATAGRDGSFIRPKILNSSTLAAALSWIGLALVLASIVLIRPQGFPGWQAIFPVLGTVLLIWNGQAENPVNRVLASPVPVFIGLISYSLYLWHWPILVLSSYWRGGTGGWAEATGWLALSFVVAAISWRFIEQPVRRSPGLRPSAVFGGALISSALVIGLGAWLFLKDGLISRFPPQIQGYVAATQDFLQDFSRCTWHTEGPLAGIEVCPIGPEGEPRVLIWGDSHVRALFEGLNDAAHGAEVPGIVVWTAGCPPLFGIEKVETAATPEENAACGGINRVMEQGIPELGVERIILVARWAYYAQGRGTGLDLENLIELSYGQSETPFASAVADTMAVVDTVATSRIVLANIPEIAGFDSRQMARALAHGRLSPEEEERRSWVSLEAYQLRQAEVIAAFEAANAPLFSGFLATLCPVNRCLAAPEGAPVYFDNNHLTNSGARLLMPHLSLLFKGLE